MTTPPAGSDQSLSVWIDTTESTAYPSLQENLEVDVAIVGGGITGITAAYLLSKAGKSVALVERGRIAMSETGHTTAHLVGATDADYRDVVKDHGEEAARLDTEAILSAITFIESTVRELGIRCGFKAVDGFLYAEREEHRQYLQRQHESLLAAGIECEWVDAVPLPFATIGGLRFRNQHVFHIREYLLPVAAAAVRGGARVFENTLVTDVAAAEEDSPCSVTTESGEIRAGHVLLATHVPLKDRGALWLKMHVTRTYVVASRIEPGQITDALFWDTEDPYHYTRVLDTGRGSLLIVGGEDRQVGKEENDEVRFQALEQYCRERFGVTDFAYRWSGQINEPADALPFIGESSHGRNIWMATGYSGTGMTYGTLAATMLTDFVLGRQNAYASLYDPARKKAGPILHDLVTKVKAIPKRLGEKLTGLDVEERSIVEVGEGEGRIVSTGGEKYAVARIDGELRALSPACTHMGCTVAWNGAEKSWDCPCHGSRFDTTGAVLNGPAVKALERKTPPSS